MNPELTKIIEQYLQNELSEADRAAFDKKLAESDQLLNEVVLQKRLHEAAKRASVRTLVKQTGKRYHLHKQLTTAAVVVIVASAVAAATWFAVTRNSGKEESISETALQTLTQRLDRSAPMEGIEAEYFNLLQKDTVVLSEEGVLLSIPEGAFFLDGKPYAGPKIVLWQEALKVTDIIKGGLSTMSGDKLLETQGMFGLKAFTPAGRELGINPKVGVYVQIPVDELKDGMMLYEGQKGKNGMVDWQNPKPLEKLPVMADMKDLDFYPTGYEPELDKLKWRTDKKHRDSLYLSMEEYGTYELAQDEEQFSYTWNAVNNAEAVPWPQTPGASAVQSTQELSRYEVGKQLFGQKCATCHQRHQDGTGPKLFGVREKWINGGAKPGSIYQWVRNWKVAAATDPFAAQVARMKPSDTQNFPDLDNNEIDAIFDYIDGVSIYDESNRLLDSRTEYFVIPPSKVLAFWNPKFNNTILATRDFERRMQSIHGTCAEKVLDKYTDNLNKPLHEIDAMVAKMGYGEFADFAAEQVGAVKLDNPHMNNLRQFYATNVGHIRKEMEKDKAYVRRMEKAWDKQVSRAREKEGERTNKRVRSAFVEEYVFNQAAIIRQLGKNVIGVTIDRASPSGLHNIDRIAPIIFENGAAINNPDMTWVTTARKTGEYASAAGKKARITYNDFAVRVTGPENYGKLMLYLFPRELNSFQRIDPVDGKFTYSLNDGMIYDMAVVAISEKGYFIYEQRSIRNGDLGTVLPENVSEAVFNNRIEALHRNNSDRRMKIVSELDWLVKEQRNYKVQRLRIENAAFRTRIRRVVFPCLQMEIDGLAQGQHADSVRVEVMH